MPIFLMRSVMVLPVSIRLLKYRFWIFRLERRIPGNCTCFQTKLGCSDFWLATIENSTFTDCNFAATEFTECNFIGSKFINCDFRETIWNKTMIQNCIFQNIRIYRSDLIESFPYVESLNQFQISLDIEDSEIVFFSASIDDLETY